MGVTSASLPAFHVGDKLAAVVGSGPMSKLDATRRLWAYIKARGLQDHTRRTMVRADTTLQPLFGRKKAVTIFELTELKDSQLSAVRQPRA